MEINVDKFTVRCVAVDSWYYVLIHFHFETNSLDGYFVCEWHTGNWFQLDDGKVIDGREFMDSLLS